MKGKVKNLQVLILAAGLGSRFGGDKQVTKVGPSGEWILDYSLYDARNAGFNEAVLVVRPDMAWLADRPFPLPVQLAFQDTPGQEWGRQRPWGTGYALWAARHAIHSPFMVVNADDFYGASAFKELAQFLETNSNPALWAMGGFRLNQTLSPNGPVSRSIADIDDKNLLQQLVEWPRIMEENGQVLGQTSTAKKVKLKGDSLVSMNAWAFTPTIFDLMEPAIQSFLNANQGNPAAEFFLPTFVMNQVRHNLASVRVIPIENSWMGVTFQPDLKGMQEKIAQLHRNTSYPDCLTDKLVPDGIIEQFVGKVLVKHESKLTGGHINDTFRVCYSNGGKQDIEVVFQKLNSRVFGNPEIISKNAVMLCQYLKDQSFPILTPAPFKNLQGDFWSKDENGDYWRMMAFISNARSIEKPSSVVEVTEASSAFGLLHAYLHALDPTSFKEGLIGFFDLNFRWQQWKEAKANALPERLKKAEKEVTRLENNRHFVEQYDALKKDKDLPIRVIHGDPKLSNLLFNKQTGKVEAIIDWDTVQPSWIIFEFGDMVRSYISAGGEESRDNEDAEQRERFLKATWDGFMEYAGPILTDNEKRYLKQGAVWVCWMQALRFLMDYLVGDKYYRVSDEDQNLRRAQGQLTLVDFLNSLDWWK